MKVNKAFEFRIYPNKIQREFLAKTFGSSRYIFNHFLNKRIFDYEFNKDKPDNEKIKINHNLYSKSLTQLRKETDWLNKISRSCLQSSLEDLDNAFQNFFKHNNGYPKFKKKSNEQCIKYSNGSDNFYVKNKKLQIPKLKSHIKIKQHQQFPQNCKFLSLNIRKTCTGKYFAIFNCEVDIQSLPILNKNIGIDLGLKDFIVTSDNLKIQNPKYFQKFEEKLTKEQQKLSKKKKGSNNYNKQRIKIAKIYEKLTNIKQDFSHKLSKQVIDNNQVIICEDLNVKKMLENKDYSKNIHHTSWSKFTQQLQYKSLFYERTFHKIDKYFPSSKTCNCCKFINKELTIDQRVWTCSNCSANLDRDLNAAKNILEQGLKDLKKI